MKIIRNSGLGIFSVHFHLDQLNRYVCPCFLYEVFENKAVECPLMKWHISSQLLPKWIIFFHFSSTWFSDI